MVIILKVHKELHHNPNSSDIQCDMCGSCFKSRLQLDCHVKKEHEKKFKCEECSKYYGVKNHLKWHMINTHGEKKYSCTHCQKAFR